MNSIHCPKCNTIIDIDQALSSQIESGLQEKYHKEKQQLELELKRSLWTKAQAEAAKQAQAATQQTAKSVELLKEQLKAQEERAKAAEAAELAIRQQKRQLETREKQLALELERQLDQRLGAEIAKMSKVEAERFSLKEREYQKQLADMKNSLADAQRRATVTSQQLQGEAMELTLEQLLKDNFPGDEITEVKKGQFGADVIQTVKNSRGQAVGSIVYESKQTERFSEKWLPKLREDTRACHGNISVLITRNMPDDIKVCGERDHVWITTMEFTVPLTQLLRHSLLQTAQTAVAQHGKDVKMEMLYSYINSQEFRGRVEAIVESFAEMHDDLDREQRSLQQSWKKREKQILRLATHTAYMYGEMQGLVGASLPSIQGLELADEALSTHSAKRSITAEQEELGI